MLLVLIFLNCKKEENNDKKGLPKPQSNGVTVDIATAKKGLLYEYIETSAIIEACQKGEINSLVSAPVKEVRIKEGLQVSKNDTLLILVTRNIRNKLVKSKSDFIKALSNLVLELESTDQKKLLKSWQQYQLEAANDKLEIPLYPKPETPKMTVMLSRLNIQTNYNMVKEYEMQLSNCIVKAPFDGIISNINIYTSAHLSAGKKICNLTDLSKMLVKVEILEEDIKAIKAGTKIIILNDTNQASTIDCVLPEINKNKHTGTAIAYIDNPKFEYKDGQHIQIKLEKNIYHDRLYIPRPALLNRNDRNLVFVVKKNIAKWCYVGLGFGNNEYLEITKGIDVGDTVIVGGHYSLAHNVRVLVGRK